MTAEHEGARGAGSAGSAGGARGYGGMDALMAAITGEPLPEEARRDPAFLAEHRAAEADVAVLKGQLAWLAEALTGETADGETADREVADEESAPGEPVAVPVPVPAPAPVRPVPASWSPRRPRGVGRRPAGTARPPRPPRPGRPTGPRRVLRIALGSLAGCAALALVVGFGWMVTHSAGSVDDSGAASAADRSGRASAVETGPPADPARALACSRLVVEGTVAKVEPERPTPWSRVTLTVTRSYKPAHGPAEVTFLLAGGARPAPRTGQHVLVAVGAGLQNASLWVVGDTRVGVNRAWITEALPRSGHSGHATCAPGSAF
ncbi:hypothetical protein AB5L52_29045 [Streptomyces sp. CG4]|uniref:hypothetical protein n=1 Tax=Streptomyces sp. CG4 TaxID=408783 RepID=UPI0034E22B89